MNCSRPILLTSKHGADFSVPCGKCINCRASKAREWAQRLKNEQSQWDREGFLTLTYDDSNLLLTSKINNNKNNELIAQGILVKNDLQQFFKLLRYHLGDKKIKYFACGEYGSHTWRPHYHAILFGLDSRDIEIVKKAWKKGERITLDPVIPGGIEYVTGYVRKKIDIKYSIYKKAGLSLPFNIQSQGLGLSWALANKKILESNGLTREGQPVSMPRYYIRKLNLNGEESYTRLNDELDVRDKEALDSGMSYDDIKDQILSEQRQRRIRLERKHALLGHE